MDDLPPSPEEFGDEFEEAAKVEPRKSALIDLSSSQNMLDELTFIASKIELGAEKLSAFKGIEDIQKQLQNLQNLKIDTSSFEQKFDLELAKLSEKIKGITDKVDLSELDEIDINIDEINKKMKSWRFKTMLLVSVGFFGMGWFANDAIKVIKNTHQDVQSQTQAQTEIINGDDYDEGYEMIFIPPGKVVYRVDNDREIKLKDGKTIQNAVRDGVYYVFDYNGIKYQVFKNVVQKIK